VKKFWKGRLALPLGALLFLSGCGATKIGRILDEPTRYRNRSVEVQGTVDKSFGALVAGVYQVQDDTGKIYVLSNGSVPRAGTRVKVRGRVMSGVTFGTRSFGTALREESHRVKY
jgi:hypothetical protein